MAWTNPFTAVANTALTAAQWNSGVRDNLNYLFTTLTQNGKIKSSATTRNSTITLADDPELTSIPLVINTAYRIVIHLEVASGTVPDFKFDLTGPAGMAYRMVGWSPVSGAFFNCIDGTSNGMNTSGGTGNSNDRFQISGWLTTSSTAGTLALRWSQLTSDAGNTTLANGSHILLTPLP